MIEQLESDIETTGFREELPAIARCLIKATPAVLRSPPLLLAAARGALRGNWTSREFGSARMPDILSSLSGENTESIIPFPAGPKVIVVNHSFLPAVFSALARRMPKGEPMPYIPVDGSSPYNISQAGEIEAYKRWVARRLLQLELTLPFLLTVLPFQSIKEKAKVFKSAKVRGNIYSPRSLIYKINQIHSMEASASFIIFIEHRPSRGTNLNILDPALVHLTNYLLEKFTEAQLILLAFNNQTQIARQFLCGRSVPQAYLGRKGRIKSEFFEDNLRKLLKMTV